MHASLKKALLFSRAMFDPISLFAAILAVWSFFAPGFWAGAAIWVAAGMAVYSFVNVPRKGNTLMFACLVLVWLAVLLHWFLP